MKTHDKLTCSDLCGYLSITNQKLGKALESSILELENKL
jgi:hypothetical protein